MVDIYKNICYSGGNETIGGYHPRQISGFLLPFIRGMRTVNILNSSQDPIVPFESPALIYVGNLRGNKMNEIAIYKFNNAPVRTQTVDNNPYFCLSDVCEALGLLNSRKSKTQLNENGVTKSYILTKGGKQEATFINEPNLYRLIFRSNKPQAQAFANWVYEEVLPSIRQTGTYGVALKAIGGIVKRCASKAVRDALVEVLTQDDKADWMVDDMNLIHTLHRWAATKNKDQTLEIRQLHSKLELIEKDYYRLQNQTNQIKKIIN